LDPPKLFFWEHRSEQYQIRTLTPNSFGHIVGFEIHIRINTMMKTALILLATMSLAQSQATIRTTIVDFPEDMSMNPDYQFLKELGISPEFEFELMVKNGIDPRDGVIDVDSFSGEVELSELDFDMEEEGGDRQEFLLNLCGAIENLFSGTVFCTCNNPLLQLGVISFDCDYMRDYTVAGLTFTPSYFGIFQFRVFALQISFRAGICLDGLNVFVADVGDVNLGDFCLALDVTVGFSPGNGLQTSIDECTLQAGVFFSCSVCSPCETPAGGVGVALICDIATTVPCIPISIPFTRTTTNGLKPGGLIQGEGFMEYFETGPALEKLIADTQAEQQAAADAAAAAQAAQDALDNSGGNNGGGNCKGKNCADEEPDDVPAPAPPTSSPTDEEDDEPSRFAPPMTTSAGGKVMCWLFGC
jgi:hypothetical protein